jgi:hypothetical protein
MGLCQSSPPDELSRKSLKAEGRLYELLNQLRSNRDHNTSLLIEINKARLYSHRLKTQLRDRTAIREF